MRERNKRFSCSEAIFLVLVQEESLQKRIFARFFFGERVMLHATKCGCLAKPIVIFGEERPRRYCPDCSRKRHSGPVPVDNLTDGIDTLGTLGEVVKDKIA